MCIGLRQNRFKVGFFLQCEIMLDPMFIIHSQGHLHNVENGVTCSIGKLKGVVKILISAKRKKDFNLSSLLGNSFCICVGLTPYNQGRLYIRMHFGISGGSSPGFQFLPQGKKYIILIFFFLNSVYIEQTMTTPKECFYNTVWYVSSTIYRWKVSRFQCPSVQIRVLQCLP